MTTSRVPPTLPRDCTLVKRHCQSFPKRVPVLQSWSTDSPSICLHLKKTLASRRRIQPQDSLLSPTDGPLPMHRGHHKDCYCYCFHEASGSRVIETSGPKRKGGWDAKAFKKRLHFREPKLSLNSGKLTSWYIAWSLNCPPTKPEPSSCL